MNATGRWMIAVCLVVLLILMLAGCAAAPKATIPGDLVLVCYEGQYAIYSQEAQEARILPIKCGDEKSI